jgi:RecQ family ATP-dependent DNA helicase
VQRTVTAYFGFAALKAGQREVIEHLLATGDGGGDVVCKFPTGFGKSLCYCVPVLHTRRLALVVSPLCSLIQDQASKLNARCKVAYNLSSSGGVQGATRTDADEALVFADDEAARARLAQGGLLFCTPEKLACEGFRARLRALHARQPFAYFVLDEAHLAAEQGYSFRSDYLKLGWLREAFPDTRVCCFSATCNAFVSARLGELLRLRRTRLFEVVDARHNLHLSVHFRDKKSAVCPCSVVGCAWGTPGASGAGVVARAVRGYAGGEVVVFANARATVEELAGELARTAPGQAVAFYHAGLSDVERVDVQARFVSGAIDILVATMASFGTGVDMPRVCKVVIYGVPASVHTLVQLVGRGGRAGQPYSADVFASRADMTKQHMILKNETSKLPAGTHRHYAQHLVDSFALVQRLLSVAQGQDTCCLHTLLAASSAVSLELRVPFAQLAQVKAVNKRVGGGDAARWNPAVKRWVLPPLAPSTPFAAWHSEHPGAGEAPAAPQRCMRCSSCKSRKRPRLAAPAAGAAEGAGGGAGAKEEGVCAQSGRVL